MNRQDDEKLSRLLQRWQEIESPSDFDAQVWRRIRLAESVAQPTFVDWLRELLPQPVLMLTLAAVVGLLVGVSSGLFSISVPVREREERLGFLGPDTLAGALWR